MPVAERTDASPVRILRVIARMNVGGPAYHVSLLGGALRSERFDTLLVAGSVGPGEASFEELADRYGARLLPLDDLGPEIRPVRDLRALVRLMRIIRRYRPDIIHTHTAKAGMIGRTAARLTRGRRILVVHTYHGHVLEGYFRWPATTMYRAIERVLAVMTDRLIGVSQATVSDLVRLRIASPSKFEVIPLGLDLGRFLDAVPADGAALRAQLGVAPDEVLLVYVGRLVPIKRVDLLLRSFAQARSAGARVKLAVVGGGPLREALESQARELGAGDTVHFLGFREDLRTIYAAADVAIMSSDNEGTPVALIEAAAAGVPGLATDVGGVREVLTPGTGVLVPPGDPDRLAAGIIALAADGELRRQLGGVARTQIAPRYAAERLVADIADLYERLLKEHGAGEASDARP